MWMVKLRTRLLVVLTVGKRQSSETRDNDDRVQMSIGSVNEGYGSSLFIEIGFLWQHKLQLDTISFLIMVHICLFSAGGN